MQIILPFRARVAATARPRARVAAFIALVALFIASSGATSSPAAQTFRLRFARAPNAATSLVSAYVTTANQSLLFARDPAAISFSTAPVGAVPLIVVDPSRQYQTIDGFGAALTGSSAYNIARLPGHGAALLSQLFNRTLGIGLSYIRLTIGASDFSLGNYTYDDLPAGESDPNLASFSIAPDAQVLSVARAIRAVPLSSVKFMATPWSPPAWMKTSGALDGGDLLASDYGVYARYLVKYVAALQNLAIPLDAITPQNEPLNDDYAIPSMGFRASEEDAFIKTALGPAMSSARLSTKLVAYDHNWDQPDYPASILGDPAAAQYVAGSAFHCYAGNVAAQSQLEAAYPNKAIYFTECSGGTWSPNFGSNLWWDMQNLIIGATTNWARTVLLWNLALNDSNGPTNGGCTNCRGVVTVHANGSVSRNVEYYVLEHAAKFVRPGAVRIASTSSLGAGMPNVAFENLDGSKVLIVLNASGASTVFAVRYGSADFRYLLPGGAVATFRWV